MRVNLHGPFRVFDDQDRDITPKGMKERGLLALVLLASGQRASRAWMQDKLWSDRSPEQASASFRQALSKLRKAMGPMAVRLQSDRAGLWFDPQLPLDNAPNPALGELLADIEIADPEFTDWMRLKRLHAAPGTAPCRTGSTGRSGCDRSRGLRTIRSARPPTCRADRTGMSGRS